MQRDILKTCDTSITQIRDLIRIDTQTTDLQAQTSQKLINIILIIVNDKVTMNNNIIRRILTKEKSKWKLRMITQDKVTTTILWLNSMWWHTIGHTTSQRTFGYQIQLQQSIWLTVLIYYMIVNIPMCPLPWVTTPLRNHTSWEK